LRISVALGAGVGGVGVVVVGSEDSFEDFGLRGLEFLDDLGGLMVYFEVILVCHLVS
jgi:hypothetical protein